MSTLGVIGSGEAWRRHIAACARIDDLNCIEIPFESGEDSIGSLLSQNNLDAVSICTTMDNRFDLAAAAASAGMRVVIEHPVARSPARLQELKSQFENADSDLTVLRPQRHRQLLNAIHATIVDGAIGEPKYSHFCHIWQWESGDGGTLSDPNFVLQHVPPALDVAIWLMSPSCSYGSTLKRIFARLASSNDADTQVRYVSLLLIFENGVQPVVEIGRTSAIAEQTGLSTISIIGDQGALQHDLRKTDVVIGSGGMRIVADDSLQATVSALSDWHTGKIEDYSRQDDISLQWTLAATESLETGLPAELSL